MTKIVADTGAMDATAQYLQQQHQTLQTQVLQIWQNLVNAATALPTFTNSEEPRQALSDTIPSLTRLLAIRKFIADTLTADSKTVKGLEAWAENIISGL
jgi:hypothetical protein